MFCPKCGKADQTPETYCRQCGNYLFDYSKPVKKAVSPDQHLKANIVLSLMTAVTSLTLAILLYSFFLNRQDTPPIIYITAGFLTAICAWQVQTFWRSILLRKHFKKQINEPQKAVENQINAPQPESVPTKQLLNEADPNNFIQPSVTENTTRHLGEKVRRKSS